MLSFFVIPFACTYGNFHTLMNTVVKLLIRIFHLMSSLLLLENNWRAILGKGVCIDIIVLVSVFFFFLTSRYIYGNMLMHTYLKICKLSQSCMTLSLAIGVCMTPLPRKNKLSKKLIDRGMFWCSCRR